MKYSSLSSISEKKCAMLVSILTISRASTSICRWGDGAQDLAVAVEEISKSVGESAIKIVAVSRSKDPLLISDCHLHHARSNHPSFLRRMTKFFAAICARSIAFV